MEPTALFSAATTGGSRIRCVRYPPAYRHATHAHSRRSITLIVQGDLEERVGADRVRASALSLVVKPPGVDHADAFGPDGATTVQIIVSEEDESRLGAESGGFGPWRWVHAGAAARPMLEWLRRMRAPGAARSPGRASEEADDLFIEAVSALAAPAPRRAGPPPRWLAGAHAALSAEAVSVRSVAAHARVHPVHLAREFRREFGVTPSQHRRRERLRRAAELLSRPDAPLTTVALAAGFSDQAHMNRELRACAGLTPATYRRLAAVSRHEIGLHSFNTVPDRAPRLARDEGIGDHSIRDGGRTCGTRANGRSGGALG